MKNLAMFMFLCAAAFFCLGQGGAYAQQQAANPIDQFTGKYWVDSSEENKEAYLYGIESAIEIEKVISEQTAQNKGAKAGRKATFTLSPFERGWMKAFANTSRKEIAQDVDAWYKAHPDQIDRPVLSVIWFELIAPRLEKK